MAVVRCEHRTDLEITHDGQVDQEPKDARAGEIPEPHRHEEIERPPGEEWERACRMRRARPLSVSQNPKHPA